MAAWRPVGGPGPNPRVHGLGWAAPPSQPRPAGLGCVQRKTRPSPAHLEAYAQHSDIISRRQEGTGTLFTSSPEFLRWLQGPNQNLFCPGIPGAGKTIITSIVVEELITRFRFNESIGMAYLYCDFRRHDEQKAEHLLASLLKQLIECQSSLPRAVKELYEQHKDKRTRPTFDETSKAFTL